MKATFKLNGVQIKKELPTCWAEATFKQLAAWEILKKTQKYDAADVLAIFTDIDAETLRGSKINNLPILLAIVSFVKHQVIDSYALPKEIIGYKIKDNIEVEEIQRYADLEAVIREFKDGDPKNLEKYPLLVATYVVEPYDFKRAENLAPSFLDAPALEVLAVGNFMLINMSVLSVITPVTVRLAALPRSNWKQGMRNYIVRSAFSLSLYFLKRKLPRPVRTYLNGRLRSLSLT